MENVKKPKFKLSQTLRRISKLELYLDVVIADEVVEDYPVGWVKIRGSQDPTYLEEILPHYEKFEDAVEEAKGIEDEKEKRKSLEDATKELQVRSVTAAIVEWDEEFFEQEFSPENALQVFLQDDYITIYNQMAIHMQEREHFLPTVSIQQENG